MLWWFAEESRLDGTRMVYNENKKKCKICNYVLSPTQNIWRVYPIMGGHWSLVGQFWHVGTYIVHIYYKCILLPGGIMRRPLLVGGGLKYHEIMVN